jgi:hypothetical protein
LNSVERLGIAELYARADWQHAAWLAGDLAVGL